MLSWSVGRFATAHASRWRTACYVQCLQAACRSKAQCPSCSAKKKYTASYSRRLGSSCRTRLSRAVVTASSS